MKSTVQESSVALCPENQRYLAYKGEPILLITSADPYSAVINMDFDYIAYLDRLARYELNYTRVYPGALVEVATMFMEENPMAPAPGRLIVPWARSGVPGYAGGGNKFDLDKWDEAYFARLKDFLAQAEKRGIVVEICFFNCQYPDCWPHCPLNGDNNIQGIEHCAPEDVQTLRHPALVRVHEDYVRKITQEVNAFGNVILEFCDEPTLMGTPGPETYAWISCMIDTAIEAERGMPKKHLLAQQLEVGVDFSDDPRVPVIVTQYVEQNENRQVGGIEALDSEYSHGKPIELNETSMFPMWYIGDVVADARVEAWEFLVGGGASFNQFNSFYTVKNPSGTSPQSDASARQLQNLKHFMNGFRFVNMLQDKSFIKSPAPDEGLHIRCISEPGKQYAAYMHHSVTNKHLSYRVMTGEHAAGLTVDLPAGTYRSEWIEPETGQTLKVELIAHTGGLRQLNGPRYAIDIALKIVSE